MNTKFMLALMLVLVCLVACGKKEEATTTGQVMEKATETTAALEKAADQAVEKVGEAAEKVSESAAAAKERLSQMTGEATEQTAAVGEGMLEKQAAEGGVSQMVTTTEKTLTEAVPGAGAEVSHTVSKVAVAGVAATMTLENKMGAVPLPHQVHAEAYDCATCHGPDEPGKFNLEKDQAHELCKGCHVKEGKGPTGCKDCHQGPKS